MFFRPYADALHDPLLGLRETVAATVRHDPLFTRNKITAVGALCFQGRLSPSDSDQFNRAVRLLSQCNLGISTDFNLMTMNIHEDPTQDF